MAGKHVGFSTSANLGFAWDPKLTRAFAEGYNANPDTNPHASGSPAYYAYEAGRSASQGYETDGNAGWAFGGVRMTTNKFISSTSFTPPSDSRELTMSFWFRTSGVSGTQWFFAGGDGTTAGNRVFEAFYAVTGEDQVVGALGVSPGFSQLVQMINSNDPQNDGEWHHIMASFDCDGATTCRMYLDGVSVDTDTATEAVIGFSDIDSISIGAGHNFGATTKNYTIDLADVWIDDSFHDLSVATNREKFYNSGAVNLGDGEVFGAQPLVFIDTSNPDSGTWTQRGSLTGFAEVGTSGSITAVT